MMTVPLIPDSAPFNAEQRAWLNGYLAGLFSRGPVAAYAGAGSPAAAAALKPLTILFGSQTGTAESLAKRAAKEAGKRGFAASIMDMAGYPVAQLAQEKNLIIITSTYGEGEPPDNAKALHAAISGPEAPRLNLLNFSVCALGDTNYVHFCKCGKDFDEHLGKLGATRVHARADCDLEYEEKFTAWLGAALGELSSTSGASLLSVSDSSAAAKSSPAEIEPKYSKKNPFPAPLLAVRCLNAAGSAKEVNHIELSLGDSCLSYEAGDALGVLPQNCPDLVDALLTALGYDGEEAVPLPDGTSASLRHALTVHCDIAKPTGEFISRYGAPTVDAGGATIVRAASPHVIDIVIARPETRLTPVDFVRLLRKIQPRLYSIASSPRAHPGQVHLTVSAVRYEAHGRSRKGVCSTFLGERCPIGANSKVFIHSNLSFRPPANPDTPMIMVGPGTGIAPFRAFLEERQVTSAKGRNWLFFGDQRSATDFLYRDELLALQAAGVLTRLDTAFSRDQPEKIYVQQRMLENAAELYSWLEAGAHFYVCGDASRMAKDVDAALHSVIEAAGGKSPAEATTYVQVLKATKRYARDVY